MGTASERVDIASGFGYINPLTPNDTYSGRIAPLTSKRCILCIYSTNIGTEYFKRGIYSPIFLFNLFHNSNVFGSCVIHILYTGCATIIKPLRPNDPYRGRTAPLTSKSCILYIYSTNIGTEYFKHGIYSPVFFSSWRCSLFHNSNVFGSCIIHILYTACAKIKKNNSGAKRLCIDILKQKLPFSESW